MKTILYVHGMGGGADSRIPCLLKERLSGDGIDVFIRTYSFDPETAIRQLDSWMEECRPAMVIGESLGARHAMRLKGVPHIFVSPAMGAPAMLARLAWTTAVPGIRQIWERAYKSRDGDRQELDFRPETLAKYRMLENCMNKGDPVHAFFGKRDKYRATGVVSLGAWDKNFGINTRTIFNGTHFMEEEFIDSLLVPAILQMI